MSNEQWKGPADGGAGVDQYPPVQRVLATFFGTPQDLEYRRMIKNAKDGVLCQNSVPLPQTRVLGPGCSIDGNVAVGVFPECEEIFVGSERSDAGGGIRPL